MSEPREDGPKLQKLFAKLEGPGQHLPPETAFEGGVKAPKPEEDDSPVDVGPIHYAERLHESGEAAIQIVCNMCECEAAMGNLRNVPEPILGWYLMTLTYQLCVLEATLARYDQRKAHAAQLQAVRDVFDRFTSPYAKGVREEVDDVLERRYRPKGLEEEDRHYRGVLTTEGDHP